MQCNFCRSDSIVSMVTFRNGPLPGWSTDPRRNRITRTVVYLCDECDARPRSRYTGLPRKLRGKEFIPPYPYTGEL